jgi:hypothetical protein
LFRSPAFATSGGSLLFSSTSVADGSALSYANEADFRMGTGSFTIEWFQYFSTLTANPRPFSIGTYSTASIGASLEGGVFYLWRGGSANSSFNYGPIANKWVHFAIVGENNATIKVYQDGVLKTTYTGTYNFNDTTSALTIGNETARTSSSSFTGYITNFRWTKGTAVYTSAFTVPTAPLNALADTKLLLLANTSTPFADSSGLNKAATNFGVVGNSATPF